MCLFAAHSQSTFLDWMFEKLRPRRHKNYDGNFAIQSIISQLDCHLPSTAESASASEEHVEEIHRAMETWAASVASLLNGRLATFIINGSLLLVRENFVCHWDLLELFALIWILAWINKQKMYQVMVNQSLAITYFVGVVFQSELSVSLFKVFRGAAGLNT